MKLTIKEKEWNLVWGLGAFEELCNELNISFQDIDAAIMMNETPTLNRLVYCALKNGADINDDTLDFSYKFFLNWLDNQPEEMSGLIMNDFKKSYFLGKTMEERFAEIIDRLNATADSYDDVKKPTKKKKDPLVS